MHFNFWLTRYCLFLTRQSEEEAGGGGVGISIGAFVFEQQLRLYHHVRIPDFLPIKKCNRLL